MFAKPVSPQQMWLSHMAMAQWLALAYRVKQNISAAYARPVVIERRLFMDITQCISEGKTIKLLDFTIYHNIKIATVTIIC